MEQFGYFDTSSGGGLLVQKYQFVVDGGRNAFYLGGAFWPAMVIHTLKLCTCIGVFMLVCIYVSYMYRCIYVCMYINIGGGFWYRSKSSVIG